MHRSSPIPRLLPTAAALACALGLALTAHAQTRDADEKALEAAHAELEQAARRVAELSRRLGAPDRAPVVIDRRIVRRPVLGVVLEPDAERGVRIAGVTPDSGAARAGLRGGDRVLAVDGRAVEGATADERTEHARTLLAGLTPERVVRIDYERDGTRSSATVTPSLGVRTAVLHADGLRAPARAGSGGQDAPPGVAPGVHREIIRLRSGEECRGDDCGMPMIAEALRWNGLNLASVDAQLGRYFGTDRGVLVLSTSPRLGSLQAGDVIRTIDGAPVASPREAMALLRARPADSTVAVGYLRDRREAVTQLKVPKAAALRIPAPPAPPAPPLRSR